MIKWDQIFVWAIPSVVSLDYYSIYKNNIWTSEIDFLLQLKQKLSKS